MDVEPQEPEQRTDDQRAEERDVGLRRLIEQRDQQERDEREDERSAGETVEAVGDVHAVARRDDGDSGEEDVHPRRHEHVADERDAESLQVIRLLDLEGRHARDHDEPQHLLPGSDALAGLCIQVVVERAQDPDEAERRERSDDAALGDAQDDDHDDEKPAHRRRPLLDEVRLRAFLANPLAHADEPEQPDVGRHQDHDEREGQEQALDELERHRPSVPAAPSSSARRSTRTSSAIPRDALTRTTSPPRSRARSASRASSRSATSMTRAPSSPALRAPSAIPEAPRPITTTTSATRAAASPTDRWPLSCASPSSSISPRTAIRRPGRPPRSSSAAATDPGDALYESSTTVTSPRRTSCPRCGADQPVASASTTSSSVSPAASPTAAAASALWTDSRPSVGMIAGRRPEAVRIVNCIPSTPADSTPSARTSASSAKPYVTDRARVLAPIRRTRSSSALRTAVPSSGSASTSSPFACSIASSVPIRDRWTACTAVTTPISGRAIAARSRISPPTYIPISRTAARCSGPSRSTVSGSPISLFRLPSLRSVVRRCPRTPATASFVEVLAMLPLTATTSGSNRARHVVASAWSAARASVTRTIDTSPSAATSFGGRVTRRHAAPAAAAASRKS